MHAVVNYATEKATVTHPPDTSPQELIATIEQAGYTAALPEPVRPEPARRRSRRTSRTRCSPRTGAGCWSAPR